MALVRANSLEGDARAGGLLECTIRITKRVGEPGIATNNITLIAHQTGISRTTVNKYLNMEHPPARKTGKRSGSVIDPYKEYLVKRWNDGVRNAQQIYREIKEMGCF